MKRWIWWALALLIPGGLVIAAVARARAAAAPVMPPDDTAETHKEQLASLVETATKDAATIQDQLKNNPLAASLLGVDPSLINSTPAVVEKNKARIDELTAIINEKSAELTRHNNAYVSGNHDGGIDEATHQSYVAQLSAAIAAARSELSTL